MEKVKDLTLDDLLARLRCPLSGKLFGKPVVASDGRVYEETELVNYLEGTNELGLSTKYKEIVPIQTLVNYIVERYPELKSEQYRYDTSNSKRSFMRNVEKIKSDIAGNRFDALLQYDNFKISALSYVYYMHIIKHAKENVLSHVISRTIDINEPFSDNGSEWSLLNKVLQSDKSTVRMILKYAKNINVNSICTSDGWSVAHQAFYYNLELDIIKLLISKGMKITTINRDGVSAAEACMECSKYDVINYILKDIISSVSSDMAGRMISCLYDNGNIMDDQREEFVGILLAKNTEN
jgi:hypothetical protein